MAGDGSLHSRVVAALRVALPLAALALMATLFLFSNGPRRGDLPYAEAEIEALLREPRMTAPEFAGVTSDGTDLRLTAESARSDIERGGTASAARPVFDATTADGTAYRAVAAEARLDPARGVLVLSGGVVLTASTGWRVETAAVAAALDRTWAETQGGVAATGPAGRVTAGRMRLTRSDRGDVLVFKDGVKLLYAPGP